MDVKSAKKAALYCRTEKSDATAIQRQLDELRQYASENGLEYKVYMDLAQIVRLFGKYFAILKRAKLINLLPWSLADMAEMLLILCLFCISKYHNTVLRSLAYMKAISQQKSAIDWHIANRLQAEIARSYQDEGGIYEYSQSECRYT